MRPLHAGTSGFVGFVGRGYSFKVCYNEEGSDPENLGNDIVDFIVSHTAQELEELKGIVDKVSPLCLLFPDHTLTESARRGHRRQCRENDDCRSTIIAHHAVAHSAMVPGNNDPGQSWVTEPDSKEEEKLSARQGLAAGMGLTDEIKMREKRNDHVSTPQLESRDPAQMEGQWHGRSRFGRLHRLKNQHS